MLHGNMSRRRAAVLATSVALLLVAPVQPYLAVPPTRGSQGARTARCASAGAPDPVSRRVLLGNFVVPCLAGAALLPSAAGAEVKVGSVSWPPAAGAGVPPAKARGAAAPADVEAAAEKVRAGVREIVAGDPKKCASILRVAFHDAIARDTVTGEGGANGSIRFELERRENYGVGKALALLEGVHAASGLSWGDTIAIAGSEAVTAAGGPRVPVATGRVDADRGDPIKLKEPVGSCREATVPGGGRDCRGQADATIPSAGLDSDGLRNFFYRLGFDDEELVALMGGHTLGRWTSLLGVPKECLKDLNSKWERCLPYGERLPFVAEDPDAFTNSYFKWLLKWNRREITNGDVHFIPTDVVLVVDDAFRAHVEAFAADQPRFFVAWARAYTRLVSLGAPPPRA
jgi:hypothetical protein